jgi:serine/threonine-protein kinase
MHKHLKAELVPPDHVNPKLSAGISEVVEMMMAKDPRKRYQSAKDLLTDLRAVKTKQPPPLAHKDFAVQDLAQLARAEASTPTEIPVSTHNAGSPLVRPWLLTTLVTILAISLIANVIQALTR